MSKDDSTLLNFAYIAFAAAIAFVCYQTVLSLGVRTNWVEKYDTWFSYANIGLAILVGMGSTWALRANAERHEFFLSAIAELRKVTWPSSEDTRKMTMVVCVVVVIFAMIVGVFDLAWAKAIGLLLS